jgi:hypothetical protein
MEEFPNTLARQVMENPDSPSWRVYGFLKEKKTVLEEKSLV